jgi:hypothetical protein
MDLVEVPELNRTRFIAASLLRIDPRRFGEGLAHVSTSDGDLHPMKMPACSKALMGGWS